ncbi:2,3-dihydroxybenzoate-AMP ligase [Nocardioides gansuensis]|uniref:2,3-dihydroxybenzoate-AMP ligase n=1 Tax=Nocardioides gansuensis TaxID=2138300 RepID=A0A2T8F8K4_9ACTN|nr:AMP-binding protein [Nocardioides gansuensis]PVG81997.1 2,3-dihydroxybenzoate-AMP ligase [Nocardioides gansuensis]
MVSPIIEGVVPWPADVAAQYVDAGYWENRALGSHLWEQADRTPDAAALVDGDLRLSYAELVDRADAAATRLAALGLEPGHRVLVQLVNGWEFVVLTLACLRAGVVPVMALPGHRRHELEYLANHAEATAIAVPDSFRGFDHQALATELVAAVPSLERVLVAGDTAEGAVDLRSLLAQSDGSGEDRARWDAEQPAPDEVAVFLLSGGTTGLPKLIARTHNDYVYNAKCAASVSGFDRGTVYLVALPAGHNFPLACPGLLGALLVGGTVVMLDSPEPVQAFATIAREGVTHTAAVPAVAQKWIDHAAAVGADELATLRVLQVGGSRLVDEVARRVRPVLGCTLQQVFGMAEGLLNYTRLDDPDDVICCSQGRPMSPGDEVLLVDELDRAVPDGTPGALLTRGPYTPRGYYRAAEHNARAFTADGWYRSGDICVWDATGNLVVAGRDKDLINRGGEKISAEEVENLVYLIPDVEQVAAVAMPDSDLGERVCVYVVCREASGLDLAGVREALQARQIAAYKLPEHLVVVDALPQTKVGKIDKRALREDIVARLQADPRVSR